MPVKQLVSALMIVACAQASSTQEKAGATKVTVEVHLSAEHAPETIKAKTRADLVYIQSNTKTKKGKVIYNTRPVAEDLEVVSVKRVEKPADPAKAVVVELRVTKEQAAKIEKMKTQAVTVVETEAGKSVMYQRPVTLRLEPAKAAKE